MISPIRFAGALSLLLAAVVNVDAAAHPHDLTNAAMSATKKVPALRSKDVQRKSRYGDIVRSLKIKQTRSLEDAAEEGDGGEDYEADGEDADYDWGNYQNEDAGFAMSDYSFKYTGCSTVQTWSDDLAGYGGEDNILVSKRFATFRLCEDCSDSSGTGCNNNYGEYVVSMDQFLLAMTDFNEERVIGYCEYCQTCAGIEAFKSFVTEAAELKNTSLSANYEVYEQWMTDNGIEEDDQNSAAEQYYTYVRYGNSGSNANNGGNYANNYQNGNYNSNYQSSSNGYSSQQWWSNVGNNNNGEDGGNNSGNSNYKQQDWSFGNYGTTFMGVQVLPGYYDADGVFVAAWGYMSATEDVGYVSLEEDDNMSVWIELFGELPEGWDENWAQDGGEVESCNYDYAGSCYSQYASCMLILGDEDFTQAYEETYGEMVKMADFLECTAVDWDGQDKSMYQYYSNSNTGEGEEKQQQECEDCEEQSVYVGPSCSNGKTIKLAVYSDQYCSQLTDLTVQQVLGDVLMDDDSEGSPIDMIPNTCISCLASEEDMWYENEEVEGGEDGLNPMCAMLYQYSGKCNANMNSNSAYSIDKYYNGNDGNDNNYNQMYQSAEQENNENAVCSFINMITSGTYSDSGKIILTNDWSRARNWKNQLQLSSAYMSAGMKWGLSLSALACVVMVVWACSLHSTLARKNIPWRPRRGKASADATDFARQQSGIVVGRKVTGTSPLI